MINQIKIIIKGKPKAQQRHRHTKRGFVYDPSKKDKDDMIVLMRSKAPKTPFTKPIGLYLRFNMPYVKKHYRTGKFSNQLKPNLSTSYKIKPDIDNMLKFVMDAGNGLLWKDDSQIYRVDMEKCYAREGSTEILIVEDSWED